MVYIVNPLSGKSRCSKIILHRKYIVNIQLLSFVRESQVGYMTEFEGNRCVRKCAFNVKIIPIDDPLADLLVNRLTSWSVIHHLLCQS